MFDIRPRHLGLVAAVALFASACAPPVPPSTAPPRADGLPPVPLVDGPLDIRVVHPTPGTPRPNVDSTLVYGSVGTGRASLEINARTVQVAPNGAFLAFVPVPRDGVYNLRAQADGRSATATRSYREPAVGAVAPTAPTLTEFPQPRGGVIVGGADTLRTGSDVSIGRTAPTGGEFRWFLPRGAQVAVTGQRGEMLRVRLDTATAWIPANDVSLAETGSPAAARSPISDFRVAPSAEWVDLRLGVGYAPFQIRGEANRVVITIHDRHPSAAPAGPTDPLIAGIQWLDGETARAEVRLAQALWGYKAFYEGDGTLVVRLRRPPAVDRTRPLAGLRILVDPGHPPAGATGPTGLTEAEANLAIGLRLRDLLQARGAEVVMTRTSAAPLVSATDAAVELRARTRLAVDSDAHLMVSVHNNAFPEGVDPFRSNGTSTYYYHPFASELARLLNEEILSTTRLRDLGHRAGNLAAVRPTWVPSVLTESLFMPVPEQESALRDPTFLDRLAAAHVTGLERFLRLSGRD